MLFMKLEIKEKKRKDPSEHNTYMIIINLLPNECQLKSLMGIVIFPFIHTHTIEMATLNNNPYNVGRQ